MLAMATMAFVASNIAAISIDIGMPLRDKFSPRPRGTWRLSAGLKGRHPPSMPSGHVAHMVLRRAPHGLATLPCKAGVRARVEGRLDLKWGGEGEGWTRIHRSLCHLRTGGFCTQILMASVDLGRLRSATSPVHRCAGGGLFIQSVHRSSWHL